MTTSAEPSTPHLTEAERKTMRNLYASGEYTLRDLAVEYGRSYETIRVICYGIRRSVVTLSSGIRHAGPPIPDTHVSLPTVLLSQRQRVGARLWWPGVATHCSHCGGLMLVRPADTDDGEVSCSLCARAVAVVGRERW